MVTETPKRRWYQFSLKTLLVVVTVSTVAFGGWVHNRRQRAQENRKRVVAVDEAVAAIEQLGGVVFFEGGPNLNWPKPEHEERRSQTWLERQFDDPGGPDDPVGAKINYVGFDSLGSTYGFDDPIVTDAGLKYLNALTNLETLNLDGTNITDAGLEHLKGLTNLRTLYLNDTKVTDLGLVYLEGLTELEYINLWNTNITDAGLRHLKGLASLETLLLYRTKVTDAGVKNLQKALPNCEILH
ncbi:MAG: leucine-rich repeat domain-containing protein [Planctomycetes bacterium]|nr:leucine-rich repeat domain-containing protein [Planctomycetota bacterium]